MAEAPAVHPEAEALHWLRRHAGEGASLRSDSRAIGGGDVFAAWPGAQADGRRFVPDACARGASALLVEAAGWQAPQGLAVPVLAIDGLRQRIGPIAAGFYGDPGERMLTIAVTGTNGKTSSCQWVAQALSAAGRPCATMGTLGCGFPGNPLPGTEGLTTPEACELQRLARVLCDAGAQALCLEASSIGLAQGRLAGLPLQVALFTNLTRDHIDFHGDMERYGEAKRSLFSWPGLRHAVINSDDPFGRELLGQLQGGSVIATATTARGDPGAIAAVILAATRVEHTPAGLRLRVLRRAGGTEEQADIETPLHGAFNVENLLGVLGVLGACGLPLERAAVLARGLRPPPGRLQAVGSGRGRVLAVVDYAHTPDAIAQALQALRPLAGSRGGRLHIVFGAGGDRDRGKRPLMAGAAARHADRIILTSDNPRTEDPGRILDDVAAGFAAGTDFHREPDRARAIDFALRSAGARDVVLIAGKGHEPYQEIAGVRHPFSDVEQARGVLAALEAGA